MTKMIKLFKVNTLDNGVVRLQSQLLVGKDSYDFIIDDDGICKCWGSGNKGFNFYPYAEPYKIIENIEEMRTQQI